MFTNESKLGRNAFSDGKVTRCGKSFLLESTWAENCPPVLHLTGTPYEMGFAHGKLLSEKITYLVSKFGTPVYAMFAGWKPGSGSPPTKEQMLNGKKVIYERIFRNLLPAIKQFTPEFLEELNGLYAGLKSSGSPVDIQDLLFLNTGPESSHINLGCSNFSAWDAATEDGRLIHAVNQDVGTFGVLHKSTLISIVKPEKGNAYLGVGWIGSISPASFLNEKNISYGEMTSNTSLTAWPQIPHFFQEKLIALNADTLQDVVAITRKTGGTTGFINMVCQAKNGNQAICIETAADLLGVREPGPEFTDLIYATNHFNNYPGWQGYEGPNLVQGQIDYWSRQPALLKNKFNLDSLRWEDVDTPQKWQEKIQCKRFQYYRDFLKENHGSINLTKAIEVQSSFHLSAGHVPPLLELVPECEHLYGYREPIKHHENLPSVYCCIFVPEEGTAWIASGAEPAQAGTFWRVNLFEQLEQLK